MMFASEARIRINKNILGCNPTSANANAVNLLEALEPLRWRSNFTSINLIENRIK